MSELCNDVGYKVCLQALAKSCLPNAVEITLIVLLTNASGAATTVMRMRASDIFLFCTPFSA